MTVAATTAVMSSGMLCGGFHARKSHRHDSLCHRRRAAANQQLSIQTLLQKLHLELASAGAFMTKPAAAGAGACADRGRGLGGDHR